MGVRFAILGPVEVSADGRRLPGLAPRHRAALGYLLLHAGTVVSAERLAGAIWGGRRPDTARAQVHAAVTAIRRVLRAAGAAEALLSRSGGYVILPGSGQFDLDEFTTGIGEALERTAVGDGPAAADRIRAALALWRGEPLADVTAAYAAEAGTRLQGRRLAAVEQLAELELSLGRHDGLIDELAAEVAANPLRERLCGQLMLALHRAGRQADALSAARAFRAALAEQQGLDPSRAFAALEQAILRDDPGLQDRSRLLSGPSGTGSPGPGGATEAAAVPVDPARRTRRGNFLPYDTPDFTGRAAELEWLDGRLRDLGRGVTILAIDGMPGIGKTALAVHAGHGLAGRFPDGQLFADLRAHTPRHEPVEPGAALAVLLGQLGVPAERIPPAAADRAALWRAELSDRRVLVVLDNAADTDHVQPLLPGGSSTALLVTSRRQLIGLEGARVLSLDLLPAADAVDLFTRIVGDRAAAEPVAALDVMQLCGFLPLAIRIAGARLQHRPQWTVSYLAGRLRDQRRRLAELSTPERGVAAAFAVSHQQLEPGKQRMFRLLGLHPGRDIAADAAAALAGVAAEEAEVLLEGLLDTHLLAQAEPGRYTFHDLLREHARATAAAEERASVCHDALTRLLDHYLHTAAAAISLLYPYSQRPQPAATAPADAAASFEGAADAAGWLDAERGNLIAAGVYAAGHGWPVHASDLACTLFPYLYDYGHHADALTLHAQALHASRQRGDKPGEGRALADLGWACWRLGRYSDADEHARAALRVCQETGDRSGQARALSALGGLSMRQRDYAQAHQHLQHALDACQQTGERVGETHVLINLGIACERQGRYQQAHQHLRRALALLRDLGCGERCLEQAIVLAHLAVVYRQQGQYEQASRHHRHALAVFRELGNHSEEAAARNGLGETAQAMADPAQAATDHDAALTLASKTANPFEQARAHHGLARAHHQLGHISLARDHASQAHHLYAGLGLPEATEVGAFLARLG